MGLKGSIEVITGPMFSGKSTELIRRAIRHRLAGRKVSAFKPDKDCRSDWIESRNADKMTAESIDHFGMVWQLATDADVIVVDELQFFDIDFDDCQVILDDARQGRIFLLAGLDLDQDCVPFHPVMHCMGVATEVTKLTAICGCGSDAHLTEWISDLPYNDETRVGDSDKYAPKCLECFVPYYEKS